MSDKIRKQLFAVALAVVLIGSVVAGGAVVAAQTDAGNETDGNETEADGTEVDANETEADANETEAAGNETEADANETEADANETEADANETEADANVTEAGANETEAAGNETDAGANETEAGDEVAADNETIDTQNTSYLRIAHATADVSAVNVSIDNETVLSNVSYGTVSEYQTFEAGDHNVTITAAVDQAVLFEGNVTLDPRTVTTLAATVNESENVSDEDDVEVEPVLYEDDAYKPEDGESAIRVVHLSTAAPNLTITAQDEGTDLTKNLSYQNASEYVTLPEGDYALEIRAEGDTEPLHTINVTLEGGTAYSEFVLGYLSPDSPDFTLTEDATTTVNLPSEDGEAAETEEEETEEEETEEEETEENETAAEGNETVGAENETAGDANETDGAENETVGNETAGNETVGNETAGNETAGNETGAAEADGNETGAEEEDGNETGAEENESDGA